MRSKIENILIEMGVTPNYTGFRYICRMIEIVSLDDKRKLSVCEIYSEIAKEYETSASSVERSIRHAISKMDKSSIAWEKYVGSVQNTRNSTVIYVMAYRIKEDN